MRCGKQIGKKRLLYALFADDLTADSVFSTTSVKKKRKTCGSSEENEVPRAKTDDSILRQHLFLG